MTRTAVASPTILPHGFRSIRQHLVALILFSFALNVLAFAGPLFSLQVFDRVLTSQSSSTLVALLLMTVCLVLLQATLDFVRSMILQRLSTRFDDAVAAPILARMTVAGRRGRGAAAGANAVGDLDHIRNAISGPPATAALDLPWLPLYLAACFMLHPFIGWTVLGCGILLATLSLAIQISSASAVSQAHSAALDAAQTASVAVRRADALHALGMDRSWRARWLGEREVALSWQAAAGERSAWLMSFSRALRLLLPVFVTAIGAWLVISNAITPGVLIAATTIAARALLPLDQVVLSWRSIEQARQAWHRLDSLERQHPEVPEAAILPAPSGHLEVTRLVVAPPGSAQPSLRNVSFTLEPGDVLGVIGSSGAGKSTLARVLTGIEQPLAGEVRFDGARIEHWNPEQLARETGYLPQDCALLPGTIAENIGRFDALLSVDCIVGAAKAAAAHEMIQRLTDGYETRVSDGGIELSGGQRQRVALARALYADPRILILDEPNAALDAEGEAALTAAVSQSRDRGAMVIIMTHRMGVLAAVNKLLVLEYGQVRAFGPRDAVIAELNRGQSDAGTRSKPAVVHGGRS
jgi:PrtD family type I secretion system ABC transporter